MVELILLDDCKVTITVENGTVDGAATAIINPTASEGVVRVFITKMDNNTNTYLTTQLHTGDT